MPLSSGTALQVIETRASSFEDGVWTRYNWLVAHDDYNLVSIEKLRSCACAKGDPVAKLTFVVPHSRWHSSDRALLGTVSMFEAAGRSREFPLRISKECCANKTNGS